MIQQYWYDIPFTHTKKHKSRRCEKPQSFNREPSPPNVYQHEPIVVDEPTVFESAYVSPSTELTNIEVSSPPEPTHSLSSEQPELQLDLITVKCGFLSFNSNVCFF